jgi:type II restriction/modification system DNA methylase subunit YeeA
MIQAAPWPQVDVIIGNPPFLGAKLMKRRLGVETSEAIRNAYDARLPGFTDPVCYWFENARAAIEEGTAARAGLVATNSIRKNTNLPVLHRIAATTQIFEAWSEEQWTVDGAAVDVSLICFGQINDRPTMLDGRVVNGINPDLTTGLDLTAAKALPENKDGAFLGIQKSGPFDVPGSVARTWMKEPSNPNGRRNADVLKPYWNGDDLTGRPRDVWFIDLPLGLDKADAALFVSPFTHIASTPSEDGKLVEDLRKALGDRAGPRWWEPHWPRPEMRSRIERLERYLETAETALHRIFVWLSYPVLPDKNLIVIPREDDLMFGLLQSRVVVVLCLRQGGVLVVRPRYTHTSTFATFPFPAGMTPANPVSSPRALPSAAAIEKAATRLNELRSAYLYPAEQVTTAAEIASGFPSRLLPKDAAAAQELASRTLTNLYNERPTWLDDAHKALDAAVAKAYGWPDGLSDEEILTRLLALNLERSAP